MITAHAIQPREYIELRTMQPAETTAAATAVTTDGVHQTKKARVFLRVKRRRSPLTTTQKGAITTMTADNNCAAGGLIGNRKSDFIAPECIKLALPAFDLAGVDTKRPKRRRMSSSIFENKEGSAFLKRLSSVNLDHCNVAEKKSSNFLPFTPSRVSRGRCINGGDEQRTPPSYSFDTTKDCCNYEEHLAAEPQSQAPVKPKRTVIFRKITDLRKCLDNQQQPGESQPQSTTPTVQDEEKKGDSILRIVDVRFEADTEDVSSCSDNSGGTGPRIRRMRTRPSDIEECNENNQNRRTKKRRKLGVAVEQSQTVSETAFWGNINANKFDANDSLDSEVLRLIDYSLASLHNQNGGSVSPHLSFLRIDSRLGFVANTHRGKLMVNRQFHGTGNGIADGRGRTVLHMAALWGDVAGVRAAIQMGADLTVMDGQGLTPAGLAKQYGQEEVSSVLMLKNDGDLQIEGGNDRSSSKADYYYELYCLEEGDEAGKKKTTGEEKKDDDREDTDSPPGLTRAKNWDEDGDDYKFELSQGFGGWNRHGELILEASGKSKEKNDEFIRRLYHDEGIDDESMLDDEHDSNDERYDGNDYPDDDDQSFELGSNYDDYQDADADYYGEFSDSSSDGGWKLDFRKRIVQKSAVTLNYDSDEEDDSVYAGPMYGEQQGMSGAFARDCAYDPEIDGSNC